jgi:lipid-A-disaccharide synthase
VALCQRHDKSPLHYQLPVAETSGDLIGAKLVSALKAQNSDIQIEGMAGERMLEAGCVQLWDKNLFEVSSEA